MVTAIFKAFYSEQAKKLAQWAIEEKQRVKASLCMKIAQRLEKKYRQNHDLKNKLPMPIFLPRPPRYKSPISRSG